LVHHRAWQEASEITAAAHQQNLEAIEWYGGSYSSEWGFSKLLHWLRNNPHKRNQMVTALENCDVIVATLCGINSVDALPRSICAMGHKWMWNRKWGGLPSEDFLISVDPLLAGIRRMLSGQYGASDQVAGSLSAAWANRLGLRSGIPTPVGALDAHWDAVGANIRLGDVVNVIGTSTCIIAVSERERLVPGVCGVVPGSVLPGYVGIEAGLSAVGELFGGIAARAGSNVATLTRDLETYRAGQTGLLRLAWDNGDRTILVNPNLGGVTLGWNVMHSAQDEFFAAVEGTAMHTRIILERMEEYGTPIHRIINTGGIPQKNHVLNQVYANVLNKPVLVPQGDVPGLGAAIFAFLASGEYASVQEAQDALCPSYTTYFPNPSETAVYERLFPLFRDTYVSLGNANCPTKSLGHILPTLRSIAAEVRGMAQS
jgi:L-ribulokinase